MITSKEQKVRANILALANDDSFQTSISLDQVINAQQLIKQKVHCEADILYVISAINLLNAAIKREEFKSLISYRDIKGNISRLLSYLVSVRKGRYNIDFFINPDEPCAYIEIHGFQFSFHNISITEGMRAFIASDDNQIRPWAGIRLQRIAGEVFSYAVSVLLANRLTARR